jgi:predicted Zn-dependent peptidase
LKTPNQNLITTGNGLDVMFYGMPTMTSAAVFTVLAGYGKESPDEYGIAHLIEHMSFKGIKGMPADKIMRELALCGAEWNASTSPHFVNYYLHCPSDNMPRAIRILAEALLSPVMSEDDLAKEKKIVSVEMADSMDDHSSWFHEHSALFHLDSSIGHSSFGRKSVIRKFTMENLMSFRKSHYRTANLVLSVCGGFDKKEVEKVLSGVDVHASWRSGEREHVVDGPWKQGARKECHVEREGISQSNLVAMFPAPGLVAKDSQAYRVLLSVLGGGMYSILNRRIREDLAMCYNVSADEESCLGNDKFSVGSIELSCSPSNLVRARDEITSCVEDVISGNFDDEVVECAKQNRIGSLWDICDTPIGLAFMCSTRSVFGDVLPDPVAIGKSYAGITKDDVVRVASKYLPLDCFRWSSMSPAAPK